MSFNPIVIDIYHGDKIQSLELAYKDGIRGVIHKATQGVHFQDKKYKARKAWALENNMLWGAYHFADATDVKQQVKNFLDFVDYDGKTLLCLDYEPSSKNGTMSIKQAREFLELVYKETGQRPVIYSGHLIKETLKDDEDEFWSQHRLWLCQYNNEYNLPKQWNKYWLWQYTGDGVGPKPHTVNGIDGVVDLNIFHSDEDTLKKEWIGGDMVDKTDEENEVDHEKEDDLPDAGTNAIVNGSLPWLETAKEQLGTDEYSGSKNNPNIMSWAKELGLRDYTADSIPWCGLFTAYCIGHNGMDVSDAPLWALSWKNWGQKLNKPKYGCVLVFKRNGGGHVGFAVGQDENYFHVLGGNQSDSVNISKIAKSRCVGYRWPSEHDMNDAQELPNQSINATITENEE